MITHKKIGVLMGGISSEREVSLKSGQAIYKALSNLHYNVVALDVAQDPSELLKRHEIEFVFIALHGGHGENGAIQGLLDVMGIPYTGSGVLASAIAMDKEASKKIFAYHGLPTPPFKILYKQNASLEHLSSLIEFPLPWVVKPATEGSSIGVSIVKNETQLVEAIQQAFDYCPTIVVEKFIQGQEVQIGILGETVLGGVEVRPKEEFYNYKAKYTVGLTEYIIPPEIDGQAYENAQLFALQAHQALGCKGVSRVDLIVDSLNQPYILEVNTLPGMTETSLIPKIAAYKGLSFGQILEEIIRLAI
jgi:D-alanine-D-alanine ligase